LCNVKSIRSSSSVAKAKVFFLMAITWDSCFWRKRLKRRVAESTLWCCGESRVNWTFSPQRCLAGPALESNIAHLRTPDGGLRL
jgi:hypothetical protein